MAEALHEAASPPPVPGFWRLGWLLFMQPLTLHRLLADWELAGDPSFWKLRGRLKKGDPVVRILLKRLGGWLLLVMPISTAAVASGLDPADLPVRSWGLVAVDIGVGIALGVAGSVAYGVARSVAVGVAGGIGIGIYLGIAESLGEPENYFIFLIILYGSFAFPASASVCVATGDAVGFFGGRGLVTDSADPFILRLSLSRLPLYPLEFALTAALRLAATLGLASLPRLASLLPYRHHELSYLPLPFLVGFLVKLGEEHPAEGRRALSEAAASLGQKGPARRALVELQARFLERAARERQYASAAALSLPFLPGREGFHSLSDPWTELELASDQIGLITLNSIATAAQDLEAARSTTSHYQRRQALTRARKELERTLDRLTTTRLIREELRFLSVVKSWLDRVVDEEAALAALERERPQVPLVFVAGIPLTPADENLFKGRRDLVRLLDQDLAAERPVPLVLLGQRRMGKSTLLNFLPRLLGTGTRVVCLNFQSLSGDPLRGEPHRWVAAEVAAALTGEDIEAASRPPQEAPWGSTLDWLATLEEPLAAADRRLLIALDEVEGLERGIRERWSDPAFLDFLRAAGDRLRRSRFLLVTAHPFSRLGSHWSDRLISAQTRRIEPLGEREARELLTRPVDGFPDIYPPGGVERLLTSTACHPYLLQLTAYDLTRRLNDAGRLKATEDDLTAALDRALEENNLFQNLWDDLTATEKGLMATLAQGEERTAAAGADELTQERRDLAREQLIQRDGESWRVAVPLFARWIREIGAAG